MPTTTIDVEFVYEFGYSVNVIWPFRKIVEFEYFINKLDDDDERKRLEREKQCRDRYLERLFGSLPPYFDHNYLDKKNYFLKVGEDAENDKKTGQFLKAFLSNIAEHLCDVVFPIDEPSNDRFLLTLADLPLQGDDHNYGVQVNYQDAIEQLDVLTADAQWIDFWASYFLRMGRFPQEIDDSLRYKIITSLENPKNTIGIIKQTMKLFTGREPDVKELVRDGIPNAGSSGGVKYEVAYTQEKKTPNNIDDALLSLASTLPADNTPIGTAYLFWDKDASELKLRLAGQEGKGDPTVIVGNGTDIFVEGVDGIGGIYVDVNDYATLSVLDSTAQPIYIDNDSVKDWTRRKDRMIVSPPPDPPFEGAMWLKEEAEITDPSGSTAKEDEWFLISSSAVVGVSGDPVEREESYLLQASNPAGNTFGGVSIRDIKKMLETVKPAGIRIYYRVGDRYIIVQ